MRTVFVNPSSGPRRRRGRSRRRRNPGRRSYRRNPSFAGVGDVAKDTALIVAGATGGAFLNRLGISLIPNFYLRNGARVAAAALLSITGASLKNPSLAAAAAGATLAPMIPEVELQLASMGATKNPHELAAELASLLEADLTDEMAADLESDSLDEIRW